MNHYKNAFINVFFSYSNIIILDYAIYHVAKSVKKFGK